MYYKVTITARPLDTWSIGAQILETHGFELVAKKLEIREFLRINAFC